MTTTTTTDKPYTEIPIAEAGTPQWHEARRHYVCASECAAVLGLSPWDSALDVYLLKRGLTEPGESNRAMRRGNALEPFIMSEFEAETTFKGFKPTFMAVSKEHDWLAANVDWICHTDNIGAEFKSSDASQNWGESFSQDVPDYYFIQVQHQLLVTGLDVIYLVALLPFSDLRLYPITPDAEVQARIIEATREFWTNTLDGIEPQGDASLNTVKKLFSTVKDDKELELEVGTEAETLALEHMNTVQQIKALTEAKESLEARLAMIVGDAKKAKIPGSAWTGSITRSITQDRLVEAHTRKGGVLFRINHPRQKG